MADPATLEILVRQAARWTTASEQDREPFIALLHASYGMAYVTALRQIAPDWEVHLHTGVDPHWLAVLIAQAQDRAMMALARVCPGAAPKGPLVQVAREGFELQSWEWAP